MTIRLLSDKVISKIAAGEIIERPASVVKELVENAIDAGATKIKIKLEGGGRNLIKVQDNGKGISKNELAIAVQKHTTSKLESEDLSNISNLGFRGEALSSITCVSRTTLMSRKEEELGWAIHLEGGEVKRSYPYTMPYGTIAEVRDLFFYTPNRLKFLKSEKLELQYIKEIVTKLALVNESIEFLLFSDDKELLHYEIASRIERIKQVKIFGNDFIANMLPFEKFQEDISLQAYSSIPTFHKNDNGAITIFINNRPIKDFIILNAVKKSYSDFIPKNTFPYTILYFNLPSNFVDVNVHPTKTEVRFFNNQLIYNLTYSTLKEILTKSSARSSTIINQQALDLITIPKLTTSSSNLEDSKADFLPFKQSDLNLNSTSLNNSVTLLHKRPISNHIENKEQIEYLESKSLVTSIKTESELEPFYLGVPKCQLYNSYIISQTAESIIIVDQHAAHERLLYEKMKTSLNSTSQTLLIPVPVVLEDIIFTKLLKEQEELTQFGIKFKVIEENKILVYALPNILKDVDIKALLIKIIEKSDDINLAAQNLCYEIERKYADFACKNAIKANVALTIDQMNFLLRSIEATNFSAQCNHGRPTYVKLDKKALAKLFERI